MSVTPRTIPPATHAPPSVARSGGPPGAPPGTGFDQILALQSQARTAPAEGRTGQTDTPTGAVDDQDATQRDAVPGEEPGTVSDPAAAVEPPAPVEAPAPTPAADTAGESQVDIPVLPSEAETSTTTNDPAATAAGSSVPVLEGSGTAQPGVEAPEPAITGASSPMPEAPVTVLEGTGTEAGPATGQEAAATVAASAPEPSETPASPAAATTSPGVDPAAAKAGSKPEAAASQQPAAGDQPKQQSGEQTGSPGQPATPAASAPSPAPQAAPPATAPPAHAAAQPQTAAGTPMLPSTVHRMQALVDFAVRKGHAQAHLELHPAELGQVNVRLRSAAGGGLTATMTVDRPEALQALQVAADQLRQSLEDQGVEVARLDIGLSAQARGDEARTGAREDGRDASGGISRRRGTDAADPDHDDPDLAPATARPLNPGALVDVQA